MHIVVWKTMLTFDRSGGKLSKETDGHFQNIGFLQLGVACVVFADQRKNQAFQMTEAVVDTSASSLLQQRFKSLEDIRKTRYSSALFESNQKKSTFPVTQTAVVFLSPYLSQFVGLFSLSHGWSGGERLVRLGSDAGTHFVCNLLCFCGEILALGAAELKCAAELESLLFMWVRCVRGAGTHANVLRVWHGGGDAFGRWGGSCLDHLVPLAPCTFRWYVEFHDDVVLY